MGNHFSLRSLLSDLFSRIREGAEEGDASLLFDQFGDRLTVSAQRAVMTLCAAVAVADGFLGRAEYQEILNLMDKELGVSAEAAGCMLSGTLSDAFGASIEEAATQLRCMLDVDQIYLVIAMLREIALAEDGIDSKEQEVLNRVRKLLEG